MTNGVSLPGRKYATRVFFVDVAKQEEWSLLNAWKETRSISYIRREHFDFDDENGGVDH